MSRNRKHQSAAIRFGPALKAFLLCLLLGGAGIGYVWQKSQIKQIEQQIRRREARLWELETQNGKLLGQLNYMKSPPYLEDRVEKMNLGLVPPQPSQVWYLKEPMPEGNRPNRELAARQSTPVAVNE